MRLTRMPTSRRNTDTQPTSRQSSTTLIRILDTLVPIHPLSHILLRSNRAQQAVMPHQQEHTMRMREARPHRVICNSSKSSICRLTGITTIRVRTLPKGPLGMRSSPNLLRLACSWRRCRPAVHAAMLAEDASSGGSLPQCAAFTAADGAGTP
jgi:hypothetical protein